MARRENLFQPLFPPHLYGVQQLGGIQQFPTGIDTLTVLKTGAQQITEQHTQEARSVVSTHMHQSGTMPLSVPPGIPASVQGVLSSGMSTGIASSVQTSSIMQPRVPPSVSSPSIMFGSGVPHLGQHPTLLGPTLPSSLQGSHNIWGPPVLSSLLPTPPLNASTPHSQFNIQPGISISTMLANPFPQNPGLSTVTSPITTLTTANHSPRLLGDDQKGLLGVYSNPAVTVTPSMEMKEPLSELEQEPEKPIKQLSMPDIAAAGEPQSTILHETSVKMEQESPNVSSLSTVFAETIDSKEGMLQHMMRPIGLLHSATEEPAPGKVYIDTALDPLLGHCMPTLGTLSYLPTGEGFGDNALHIPVSQPRKYKQTARKSLTPSPKAACKQRQAPKKRGRPVGVKNKNKVSGKAKSRGKGGTKVRKPGPKSKDSPNPVKSNPKLIRIFLNCNLVSFKTFAQLANRDPMVKLKPVDEDIVEEMEKKHISTPTPPPILSNGGLPEEAIPSTSMIKKKVKSPRPKKKPAKSGVRAVSNKSSKTIDKNGTNTGASAKTKAKTSSKKAAQNSPKTSEGANSNAKTGASDGAKAKSGVKTDAKTSPKTNAKTSPKTNAKTSTKTNAKTSPKTDTKTSPKTDTKTSPKTDTKTSPKTDTKTSAKTDAKSSVQTDAKTDAKTSVSESAVTSLGESGKKVRKRKSLGLDQVDISDLEPPLPRRSRKAVNYAELGGLSEGEDLFDDSGSSDEWEKDAGISKLKLKSIGMRKKSTEAAESTPVRGYDPNKHSGRKRVSSGKSPKKSGDLSNNIDGKDKSFQAPPAEPAYLAEEAMNLPVLSARLMPNVNTSSFPCKITTNSVAKKQKGKKKQPPLKNEPVLPCILKTVGQDLEQKSVYQCPICPEALESSEDIRKHTKEAHSEHLHLAVGDERLQKAVPYIFCRHCDFIALNQMALWNHFAVYHNIGGIMCEFAKEERIGSVDDPESLTKTVTYACKECMFTGDALSDIEKHCIRKHGQKLLMFICSNCDRFRTFSTDNLVHHVKQHQVSPLFSCTASIVNNQGSEDRDMIKRKGGIVEADMGLEVEPVPESVEKTEASLSASAELIRMVNTEAWEQNCGKKSNSRRSSAASRTRVSSIASQDRRSSGHTVGSVSPTPQADVPDLVVKNIGTDGGVFVAGPQFTANGGVPLHTVSSAVVAAAPGQNIYNLPATSQMPKQLTALPPTGQTQLQAFPVQLQQNYQTLAPQPRMTATHTVTRPTQVAPPFVATPPVSAIQVSAKDDADCMIGIAIVPLDKGPPMYIVSKTQRWSEPMYQCLLCPVEVDNPTKVPVHMKSRHSHYLYAVTLPSDSTCFLFCHHCEFITQNHVAMSLHYFTYHKVRGVMGHFGVRKNEDSGYDSQAPGSNDYVCLHCTHRDPVRAKMEEHSMKMHGTRFIAFKCVHCDFKNFGFGAFVKHHRDCHGSLPQYCGVTLLDRGRKEATNIRASEAEKANKFDVSFTPDVTLPFVVYTAMLFGSTMPAQVNQRPVPGIKGPSVGKGTDVVVNADKSMAVKTNKSGHRYVNSQAKAASPALAGTKQSTPIPSGVTIYLDESDSDDDVVVTAETKAPQSTQLKPTQLATPRKSPARTVVSTPSQPGPQRPFIRNPTMVGPRMPPPTQLRQQHPQQLPSWQSQQQQSQQPRQILQHQAVPPRGPTARRRPHNNTNDVIVIEDDIVTRPKVQIIREYPLPPTPPAGSANLMMEVTDD